jgi:6,7-dimethyl-8-ribityllumazine synthase
MATKGNTRLKKLSTGAHEFQGACVVIVKTEWNAEIVDELEKGCRKILAKEGVKMVSTITVPGAIEIPFAIKSYWDKVKYRDDRPQACQSVTAGVTHLNLHLPIPVIFGIITVNNQQQAEERIGGKHGHKGEEAAITALKMISLIKTFK